jgi:hypothetical protein
VAALPALQDLSVDGYCRLQGAPALAQLVQLTRLDLRELRSGAVFAVDYWPLVSQELPSLREASRLQLVLPTAAAAAAEQQQAGPAAAAPQLTSLTSLQHCELLVGSREALGEGPAAQPAFSLLQAMPRLQRVALVLTAGGQQLQSWQALLQQHPQICYMELVLLQAPGAQCRQQMAVLLRSLPRLTQLAFCEAARKTRISQLLSLAAGLQGLRKLSFTVEETFGAGTWTCPLAVLQALAAGACTGLQQLELHNTGTSLAAVAALLGGGGLPQLRLVRQEGKHAFGTLADRERQFSDGLQHTHERCAMRPGGR